MVLDCKLKQDQLFPGSVGLSLSSYVNSKACLVQDVLLVIPNRKRSTKSWKKLQAVQAALAPHFFGSPVFFRTFSVTYTLLLTEDGRRRAEDRELRLDKGDLRY